MATETQNNLNDQYKATRIKFFRPDGLLAETRTGGVSFTGTSLALLEPNLAAHANYRGGRMEIELIVPTCECDCDCDQDGFFKISHYCPLHDNCDCCGERLGTKKDPTFKVGKRDGWVCDECFLLCDDHGEKDCAKCAEAARGADACGYCGQDHCDCKSRYGVVQGIVSARAKGGR